VAHLWVLYIKYGHMQLAAIARPTSCYILSVANFCHVVDLTDPRLKFCNVRPKDVLAD